MGIREWLLSQMQGGGRVAEGDTWRYPPLSPGAGSPVLNQPYYAPMGMDQMMLRDLIMGGQMPQLPPDVLQRLVGPQQQMPQMPPQAPVAEPTPTAPMLGKGDKPADYDPMIDDYPSNRPQYFRGR